MPTAQLAVWVNAPRRDGVQVVTPQSWVSVRGRVGGGLGPHPDGVSEEQAAALPMAAETAWQALDDLGVAPGELLLVHGAGSTVGEAAVRFALHRGVR